MRILHLDFEKSWRGGEAQILNLMLGLDRNEFENEVCAYPESPLLKRSKKAGFKVIPLTSLNEWDIVSSYKLSRIISKGNYDIIHFHTAHSHSIGLMALKMLKKKPKVILSRRVDFLVAQNFFSKLKYSQPVDRIVAISHGVKKALIASGLDPERISVVYSGVDIKAVKEREIVNDIRNDFDIPSDRFIIGNVAALAPHKDHETLLKAVSIADKYLEDYILIIFGAGELELKLKRLTTDLDLRDKVLFAGFHKKIISYMKQFDLFVLSSNLEGLCTSLIDASACGLPIVGTRTGGIPEIILDYETGLLAEPENPQDLAEKILKMFKDNDLRNKLSSNAYKFSEKFDYKNTVEGMETIYKEVVKE